MFVSHSPFYFEENGEGLLWGDFISGVLQIVDKQRTLEEKYRSFQESCLMVPEPRSPFQNVKFSSISCGKSHILLTDTEFRLWSCGNPIASGRLEKCNESFSEVQQNHCIYLQLVKGELEV